MFKKIIFILSLFLLLPFVFPADMLEPVMISLNEGENIDLGTVAPGEYFLISFLMDKDEFDLITTDSYGKNYISFENIQTTPESIFAIARINENAKDEKQLKIILKNTSTNKTSELTIGLKIESNVISTFIMPFNKNSEFGKEKEIKIKVINKSISTKKITVSSNLPNTWFESKPKKLKKDKIFYLQPAETTEITYSFIPKVIGEKEIELYIYTDFDNTQIKDIMPNFLKKINYERNEETININVLKNLSALFGSNLYNFPTFGLNSIPVYFFNNIIRILTLYEQKI